MWRWLAGPINQLVGQAEAAILRIRGGDFEKRRARSPPMRFYAKRNLVWEMARPFRCAPDELAGAHAEMTLPSASFARVRFPEDATPPCLGGINWGNRRYFLRRPICIVFDLLQNGETVGRIDEIEYLSELRAICYGAQIARTRSR